ncbi:mechanosensitive ion channel protein MscS [Kineobactrum sediminis]|uniref:Mechanosensitive ion channel protein MscS n=1 Tax=Kineobactrum sediminis TaxID=1905677 RepID=A0A2N5Y7I4_9GAMM|nr:mechanosensitive ion channel family protein [Kineobactrum sediminis]PLW84350.1 mechanosensitive ion channel protein MscS [Kineobactrum sediminis]
MDIASFRDFWELVTDVWEHGVYGADIVHVLAALFIILVALLFRNMFTRYAMGALQRAANRTHTELDNALLDAVRGPLRFLPVLLGIFFATSVLKVDEQVADFLYNINRSLVVFTLFWTFHQLTGPVGALLQRSRGFLTQPMVDWMVKIGRILLILVGAATILELWGIAVGPIIAGLGLFGVAVALGAQDLFKNLIAGLFVIGERRFQVGDWVSVDGVVEGIAMEIGFRTTTVRRFDRAPVYVPNSRLADNAVINFSRMSHRRISWMLGVEYRTTLEQLKQIRDGIENYILDNDEFAQPTEVPTFVRIDSFNNSSIDIMLYCFTNTTVWGDWLEIKERLAYKIKEIVEDAGAGFAFPSRSLYLESLPDAPEVFPLSPAQQPGPATAD